MVYVNVLPISVKALIEPELQFVCQSFVFPLSIELGLNIFSFISHEKKDWERAKMLYMMLLNFAAIHRIS